MVVGFICEKTDERLPFEACLECARTRLNRKLDCRFDEATIAGMILNERRGTDISVTVITGCHRSVFISRFYETYVAPSQLYWAFRGQIAHKILEEANLHPDAVKEKGFTKAWDGIDITGHPDLIIPSQRVLKDYKTTRGYAPFLGGWGVGLGPLEKFCPAHFDYSSIFKEEDRLDLSLTRLLIRGNL